MRRDSRRRSGHRLRREPRGNSLISGKSVVFLAFTIVRRQPRRRHGNCDSSCSDTTLSRTGTSQSEPRINHGCGVRSSSAGRGFAPRPACVFPAGAVARAHRAAAGGVSRASHRRQGTASADAGAPARRTGRSDPRLSRGDSCCNRQTLAFSPLTPAKAGVQKKDFPCDAGFPLSAFALRASVDSNPPKFAMRAKAGARE